MCVVRLQWGAGNTLLYLERFPMNNFLNKNLLITIVTSAILLLLLGAGVVHSLQYAQLRRATPPFQGVECYDGIHEGVTSFEVDGQTYAATNGHVSWIVPKDAYWRWELLLDNGTIIVVQQFQPENCIRVR